MHRVLTFLNNLRNKNRKDEDAHIESMRLEFKARYHNFRVLLQANNKALENMGSIEKRLREDQPFNMQFVRGKSTAITVDVFRMIRILEELTQGKYVGLDTRFDEIQQQISGILKPRTTASGSRLVVNLEEIDGHLFTLAGSKMAKLGEMKNRLGLAVPEGFVITAAAYQQIIDQQDLQTEIDRQFQTVDFNNLEALQQVCLDIQKLVEGVTLSDELTTAIHDAYDALEKQTRKNVRVALRSSALGEDLARSSFAGQYRSELNIDRKGILQAYKQVLASKYSLPAVTYRYHFGIKDEENAMCVGCLAMVDAIAGGVLYSRNPGDSRDDAVYISANWGLPKSVVDGDKACDEFVVSRENRSRISDQIIRTKPMMLMSDSDPGLSVQSPDSDLQNSPSLSSSQVTALSEIAIRLETHFDTPQDIEWAIDPSGRIELLQCRPLLQLEKKESSRSEQETPQDLDHVLLSGGVMVNSGSASGPAFVVRKSADLLEFPPGSVLICQQGHPRWAPLLNQAVAVVTEEGGFAGHLANVAREFDLPAIFGMPRASEIIGNGDVITVDADRQILYSGKIESRLPDQTMRKNLITGSPVFRTLEEVSRLIVPLNLLDPDGIDFTPSSCSTLHDMTRFVHEKSVQEIFNFGKEHRFMERSSKQLVYKVPMQWWVLDLDDGFKKPVTGKRVPLENIDSIPMLALWDGMLAVPWEGPPLDGRGFMSVLFQGSANRTIGDQSRARTPDKNYFFISRNFCSLSSKLGFHFSTIESIVSDNYEDNYISFMFKGGAADFQRRHRRIHFIGDILEEFGFNVNIKSDAMVARLENRPADYVKDHLKILGYLTIHIRQLDMIMTNERTIAYYQEKFARDISRMIASTDLPADSGPRGQGTAGLSVEETSKEPEGTAATTRR
ncbi:pyruvate, water dikinase [bacterium]|nr:pyruvate, water dikinase [bacterium]